jgi:hypothetical protein
LILTRKIQKSLPAHRALAWRKQSAPRSEGPIMRTDTAVVDTPSPSSMTNLGKFGKPVPAPTEKKTKKKVSNPQKQKPAQWTAYCDQATDRDFPSQITVDNTVVWPLRKNPTTSILRAIYVTAPEG